MTNESTFDYVADEQDKKPEAPVKAAAKQKPAAESVKNTEKKPRQNTGNHPDPMEQEVMPPSGVGLAVIEIKKETALSVFTAENGLDPYLVELEARARAAIAGADETTIAGQDIIRSTAYSLSKSKKPLENLAATLKMEADALIAKVNNERDRGIDFITDLQKEIRRPLTEYEEREKTRIDVHKARLDVLMAMIAFEGEPTSADVGARINELAAFKEFNWQEFTESAKATREKVEAHLAEMLVKIKKAEDDAAELARFRAAEDEKNKALDAMYAAANTDNVAFDAAAKAKKDAEDEAERQRVAREAVVQKEKDDLQREKDESDAKVTKAEEDRAAGHTQAVFQMAALAQVNEQHTAAAVQSRLDTLKIIHEGRDWQEFKTEADEIFTVTSKNLVILHGKAVAAEKEKQRIADKAALDKVLQDALDLAAAEKKREDEAKALREADKTHRAKINNEAMNTLNGALQREGVVLVVADLRTIITVIARGEVDHLTIKY